MDEQQEYLQVLDMTTLFKKEILIYSFFDIHFKTPVRIMLIVYFFILSLVWTLPFFLIFGFSLSPYKMILAFGVPAVLSTMMSKPIWGGKTFFSWFKCQCEYVTHPKMYYDCIPGPTKLEDFKIDNKYTVSRTRDYYKLYLLRKEEKRK